MVNTLAKWQTIFVNNVAEYPCLHTLSKVVGNPPVGEEFDADVSIALASWMNDFGIFTLRHMLDLGQNEGGHTLAMLNWLGDMRINITGGAPGFNPYRCGAYRIGWSRRISGVDVVPTTWAEVNNLYLDDVGPSSLPNPDYPESYRFIARAALAGMCHLSSGQTAYDWIDTNVYNKADLAKNPKYSLVPRTMGDVTAPAAIANLAAGSLTISSLVVSWTVPGDDDSTGTATRYDLRYSTQPITALTWPRATPVSGEPTPAAAGTGQNVTVSNLAYDTTYYFAIKTVDERGNSSTMSNVLSAATSQLPGTQTITFQNGVLPTSGYAGCDDTRISQGYPDLNYGNSTANVVGDYGGTHRELIRFNTTAIPAGQSIVSAKLRLWQTTGATVAVRIQAYEVLRPWTEMNATWNNYAASLPWTTAGCNGVGTDRGDVILADTMIPANTSTQWVEIPLPKSLVQGWHDNSASNQGVRLRGCNELPYGGRADFAADNHATTTNRPMLIVSYLANTAPAVDAGLDLTVYEGQAVNLHAAAGDPDNDPLDYLWTQTAGASVALSGTGTPDASFMAPVLASLAEADMAFQVRVDDGRGGQATDSVSVRVYMLGDTNGDDSVDVVDLLTFVAALALLGRCELRPAVRPVPG